MYYFYIDPRTREPRIYPWVNGFLSRRLSVRGVRPSTVPSGATGLPVGLHILQSLKNRKLYLGYTRNLKKRLASHNSMVNKASKPNAPFELIFYSAFKNQDDAVECEKYFKTTAGWRRVKRMLKNTLANQH